MNVIRYIIGYEVIELVRKVLTMICCDLWVNKQNYWACVYNVHQFNAFNVNIWFPHGKDHWSASGVYARSNKWEKEVII